MKISLPFIRLFFMFTSILFVTSYSVTLGGASFAPITVGVISGLALGALLIGLETAFKEVNLRTFNILILGLLLGYFMGETVMMLLRGALTANGTGISTEALLLVQTVVFLFATYFGTTTAIRAADDFYLSIPFVKFKASNQKKKDLLLDISVLADARIVDLAASGLLDNHLIIQRMLIKELTHMHENGDEAAKSKARRALETIKKLENISGLNLQYTDIDFEEIKDPLAKLQQLARLLNASIITADLNRIQQSISDGVRIINIHSLSNALKPITQNGELLTIKVQRYGKEPRQGVGYLEDGTMVVVNGGAEYIGEMIKAQVLSVKHTTSGRMIFCNTAEDFLANEASELSASPHELEISSKSYFNA